MFALFALVYSSGALTFVLTPDGSDSSKAVQAIGLLVGAIAAIGLLVKSRPLDRIVVGYWPVLLVVGFALLSVAWAVDMNLAIRRSGSLLLTALAAMWIGETFRPREVVNLVLGALLAVCVASYIAIFVFPHFGIHQAVDTRSDTIVGAWRGMYAFKNDFGRAIALALVLFVVAAITRPRWRWFYLACVALAAVLILGSRSAQALLLAALCTAAAGVAFFMRRRTPVERGVLITFLIPFAIVFYMVSGVVAGDVIAALGKDPTLSGRTEIWGVVISAMQHNILLGGGYGSGWEVVDQAIIEAFNRSFGHAHNGYLTLMVDLGVVGLLLLLALVVYTVALALDQLLRGDHVEFAAFWLVYAVFYLVGNVAASFLLDHISLHFVLLVLAVRILRVQETVPARKGRLHPADR